MKFLIDECLSDILAHRAEELGFHGSIHVNWRGLEGEGDHVVRRRALEWHMIVVTHNTKDYLKLYRSLPHHPGLICFNTARGMNLPRQTAMFERAVAEIAGTSLADRILILSIDVDEVVTLGWYR